VARRTISRRELLAGAGIGTIGIAVGLTAVSKTQAASALPAGAAEELGPGRVPFVLAVNGKKRPVKAEPRTTLLRVLRNHLDLTGPKEVCDRGACGACTVFVDGKPVHSCLMLALDARGREVTTIEGLGTPERMDAVQQAFVDRDAMMCGFCTPGMVMSVRHLLDRNPDPTLADVKHAVSGNLCRCGTYPKVFEAALAAAQAERSGKGKA